MKLKSGPSDIELLEDDGSARTISSPLREFMEHRFHADFQGVLLHDNPRANTIAKALGADAFAAGTHIFFARPYQGDIGLLAHELTHVVQNRRFRAAESRQNSAKAIVDQQSDAEAEAQQVAARILAGFDAGPIVHTLNAVARNATSDAVQNLISYSAFDWSVTTKEQQQVLTLLMGDTSPTNTINDLRKTDMLEALLDRVDGKDERLELMQVLGAKLDDATVDSVFNMTALLEDSDGNPTVPGFLLRISHDLQVKLRALGVTSAAPPFNTAALAYVIGKTPTSPFGGSGATGINPTKQPEISKIDKAGMIVGIQSIRKLYDNPVGGLNTYLSSLTPQMRKDQASLLLRQPVSSIVPYSYLSKIPSRADLIRAVGTLYNLDGATIAAFILAEQRDQSSNEDAKDYQSAVSLMSYNSSIGLGQVVVSTARRNNLFGDVLSPTTLAGRDGHGIIDWQTAMLLASDDFNVFAAAKYIRMTANNGSVMTPARLPNTIASWPNIDFPKYAQNSRNWPEDNIAALGSEYTSRPWDDVVTPWGDFVLEAYHDVVAAGVF